MQKFSGLLWLQHNKRTSLWRFHFPRTCKMHKTAAHLKLTIMSVCNKRSARIHATVNFGNTAVFAVKLRQYDTCVSFCTVDPLTCHSCCCRMPDVTCRWTTYHVRCYTRSCTCICMCKCEKKIFFIEYWTHMHARWIHNSDDSKSFPTLRRCENPVWSQTPVAKSKFSTYWSCCSDRCTQQAVSKRAVTAYGDAHAISSVKDNLCGYFLI